MANLSTTVASPEALDDKEDTISFLSLVRKLSAFAALIFLFHLAFPMGVVNAQLVTALGLGQAWYADVPLALLVAFVNSLVAVLAFKFVK